MTPDELHDVYAGIGAAVWHLQFLEDVLATYLTMRLRLRWPVTPDQAYGALASERRRTLGSLLKDARDAGLLRGAVADGFAVLLDERNWLIHRSMHEVSDGLYGADAREAFLGRLRTLADRAIELKKAVYKDAAAFCEEHGLDIGRAEALAIERFHKLRGA